MHKGCIYTPKKMLGKVWGSGGPPVKVREPENVCMSGACTYKNALSGGKRGQPLITSITAPLQQTPRNRNC